MGFSNFSPSITFDTVRCMKDRFTDFLKTSLGGAWCQAGQALHINILELRAAKFAILLFSKYKQSMWKWKIIRSFSLFGKNGRDKKPTHDSGGKGNMRIFFSQSDHIYCRIPARGFKYHSRQSSQVNEKFTKRMDIKRANVPENNTGFQASGCGSVCIQDGPPDPMVHNLATRSIHMDDGCISNKLDTPKSTHPPTFF